MPIGVGEIVEGTVTGITHFGAFVELPGGETGLIHISEVADTYVRDIKNYLKYNEKIKVKVIGIDEKGKISLSIKQLKEKKTSQPVQIDWSNRRREAGMSFEDKLARFLKESEERQQDLRRSHESKRGSCGYRRREDF